MQEYTLQEDETVLIEIYIKPEFQHQRKKESRFWNAGCIRVSGGVLSGLSVSTESLEGLMAGGIALATLEKDKMGGIVTDGHRFPLYGEAEDCWLKWSPEINPDEEAMNKQE